jgi:toxin-antitoxin system PIN domain toxin
MRYLLDANLLVAWGWADHADHDRVAGWIREAKRIRSAKLFTSPIPEVGFVRVSVQRTGARVSPAEAGRTLADMLASLGPHHGFLPDDQPATDWPEWCRGAGQTTDAHLAALAAKHQAKLATLDTAIPGAFVLPLEPPEG